MLVAIGHIVTAVLAMAAFLIKLGALRRDPDDPKIQASVAICLGCAVAVIVGWAPVYAAVDQATGIPNVTKILENGSVLVVAAAVQILFLYLGDPEKAPRRLRVRLVLLTAVLCLMVAMFAAADVPVSEPLHFAERYAELPEIGVYMLGYLICLAVAIGDILRMSIRYAKFAERRLRVSMRLLAIGATFGAGYVVHKGLFIALKLRGIDPPWSEPIVSQALITLALPLVCISLVFSSAWKFADAVRALPRRRRLYRRLHPLWYVLFQATPTIALDPPRRPERARGVLLSAGQHLYRRCVEIADGLQALGPLDAGVIAEAKRSAAGAGYSFDRAAAAGEAAAILAAMRRLNSPAKARPELQDEPGLEPQESLVLHPDVEADAQRLALVSDALDELLARDSNSAAAVPANRK
ncbi:MAB_1171c family putative transporter [Micromonospora sp. CPCC 205558]|uniref:MAB_1171c family putative transporter n=1 Tax=Micromonospora sp. CPCC 205558 TaxID=3122403 RepID=UPI002FF191C4